MQFSLQSSIYAFFEQSNILKQEDTFTDNGVEMLSEWFKLPSS